MPNIECVPLFHFTDILTILKHLNQTLDKCYESLIQVLSKKRRNCPRLYLLSDQDLIEVLCSGTNLDHLSKNICKVFNQLESLKIDSSNKDDLKIVGCFGKNKEYFPLEMPIIFKGSIEEIINSLQVCIPDSLRYLLELSLSGKPPPFQTFHVAENKPEGPVNTHVRQDNRVLPAISESFEAQPPALFTWTFQHTSQIVELTLRILLTKQVEESLKSVEDLKSMEQRLTALITLYQNELCLFKFKKAGSDTQGLYLDNFHEHFHSFLFDNKFK